MNIGVKEKEELSFLVYIIKWIMVLFIKIGNIGYGYGVTMMNLIWKCRV